MARKILLSVLCGVVILIITWIYQNYDFSFKVEDGFLKKVFLVKDKIYSPAPKYKADFVFINTGKDLALVEDTTDYGNVAVSDREKIFHFINHINTLNQKPAFTVIDIQFYYPYTVNPRIDTLLETKLRMNESVMIPIIKDENDQYKKPLYSVRYAYSHYRTFGTNFNKFRILNHEAIPSIPIALHEEVNNSVYRDHFFYATCNGRLCLSSIWPSYYLKNADIKGVRAQTDLQSIGKNEIANPKPGKIEAEYYNVGEILLDLEANPDNYKDFFRNKIVIIGNFEGDMHSTPLGKMSGPVLLANIYLSLLNEQHIISIGFIILVLVAFSALSYVALFKKMPELKLNFKFFFSSFIVKFIRGYISYFGCMFLLSVIALIAFNVQVALFLPSFIFTGIEYVRQKKYLGDKPAGKRSTVNGRPSTVNEIS
jgi:hypothetical protein